MVPLVGGEWAEVKTLVLGEIQAPVKKKGQVAVHTAALSYFSVLLTDATTFGRLALVETHRRGVENAHLVAAVTDGAEWEQGFIDFHRPDAVRILDFAHAAEHLSAVGEAIWGQGTPATAQWFEQQLAVLKQQGPGPMLAELHALQQTHPSFGRIDQHLGLSGEAAEANSVPRLLGARLAHRQRCRGEWQQAGRRGPLEGRRHALGALACQPDVGFAQYRLQ